MQMDNHLQDAVAYIGWKETNELLRLYKWKEDKSIQDFNEKLHIKLSRSQRSHPEQDITKKTNLRKYLNERVPPIVDFLKLTLVTNFDEDHLLTVRQTNAYFVYFGAMTKEYIHVACWLRIPLENKTIAHGDSPKIFFWVLHTSYAQELEALGDLTGEMDVTALRKLLDLSDGIDYDLHE